MTSIQTFTQPRTFIDLTVPWLPSNIRPLMPVVAFMIDATLDFDCIHGAN